MQLFEQIQALAAAKGKEKLKLLESWKDDTVLRDFLHRTYEPTISYFLNPVKDVKHGVEGQGHPVFQLGLIFGLASGIAARRGKAAQAHYVETCEMLDADHKRLIDLLLNRDIKAGIAASTINKVWPGLITSPPYMRCALPHTAKMEKWPWGQDGFYAESQEKADGMFANITPSGEKGSRIESRNGSRFPEGLWSEKIIEELRSIDPLVLGGDVYNGELVVYKDGNPLARHIGNGIMNSLLQDGEWTGEDGMEVRFLIWDSLPAEGFEEGIRYLVSYKVRLNELRMRIDPSGFTSVSVIHSRPVYSIAEAVDHFLEEIRKGKEGTVVKRWDAIWRDGDSMEQVKMKVEFECDLVVTGVNAGDQNGRHAKTFGSLQCETCDGLLAVGVSGMSDKLRKEIAENLQNYVGKIVRIIGNDVLEVPGKAASIFLPRLDEIRLDKTTADTLAQVKAAFEAVRQGRQLVESSDANAGSI